VRTLESIYAAPVKHFALENARNVLEGKNKNVQERKKSRCTRDILTKRKKINLKLMNLMITQEMGMQTAYST
jgi:hypothetical protein